MMTDASPAAAIRIPSEAAAAGPVALLPHEAAFGGFLAVTAGSLVAVAGPAHPLSLLFLGMAGLAAALGAWCREGGGAPLRWRAHLLFYAAAMNLSYFNFGNIADALRLPRRDAALQAIDAALVGGQPALALQAFVHPVLTDALGLCYAFFFPLLLDGIVRHLRGRGPALRRFCAGLFTVYGVGFIGYLLVPAAGPVRAMADAFTVPLRGGWLTDVFAAVESSCSNGVDAFPSLHCAVTAYLLFFDRARSRRRFRLLLVPCAGLCAATIYLRYHYLVDVFAGFVLAAIGLAAAGCAGREEVRQPSDFRESCAPSTA